MGSRRPAADSVPPSVAYSARPGRSALAHLCLGGTLESETELWVAQRGTCSMWKTHRLRASKGRMLEELACWHPVVFCHIKPADAYESFLVTPTAWAVHQSPPANTGCSWCTQAVTPWGHTNVQLEEALLIWSVLWTLHLHTQLHQIVTAGPSRNARGWGLAQALNLLLHSC